MALSRTARALIGAGLAAGLSVGLVEGVRAAWVARVGFAGGLRTILLVIGVDVVAGLTLGALLAVATFAAVWGRRTTPGRPGQITGWIVMGCASAAVAGAAVTGTALRNNRFLAAGVVVLAALAASIGGAIAGPATARLVSRGRGIAAPPTTPVGSLIAAPFVALVAALPVFFAVWQTRLPLPRDVLVGRVALVALVVAGLPWALARASALRVAWSWHKAIPVAAVLWGLPAVALVATRWVKDFQFLPWQDVLSAVALLATGAGAWAWLRRRNLPGRGWPALLAFPSALLLVLWAGASEPARKAAAVNAGLVGHALTHGRVVLDFDGDGYPRLLGGGDCDDADPTANPGAQDWPDDGVDQDCDGHDASVVALHSPPLHPVPDSVPPDLNILFVTIDTLRADHLGCYGYGRPTSPELDRLAAAGTVFENGWAHAPSTRYSMPAIATGRWPSTITWDESIWWPRIASGQRTIGEALKNLGYTTAAFYAYLYFNRVDARGFERGIDYYDDRRAALHVNVNGPVESVGSSAREMADDGIAFIDAHKTEKFFLWLHFYDPHLSYERHRDAPPFGTSQADLYDGEIWFTDQQLGRVLAHLKSAGLWDKTAVVVTGDHGEGLGEKGIQAHGYHLYAPQTKVPFVARVPGLSPRRVKVPVGHVDLAPTLLNLARGAHEPSFLGRSFVDLMAHGAPAATVATGPVFQEVSYEGPTRRRALVNATHQLIWNWVPHNTTECYDLTADLTRDLWGTAAGEPSCSAAKRDLQQMVAALSLPPGYADKIATGVSAPGVVAAAPAHPLEARFGSAVKFLGYDLSARVVARGGDVELVCHFESVERLSDKWRPFFHLDGPGGFRNIDHVPVQGAYPVERWRPGQRIRDRFRIAFPPGSPPGDYTVYVGFYNQERLPVDPPTLADGQDRLRITSITVR